MRGRLRLCAVLVSWALAVSCLASAAAEVKAERYPQRPIRLIVPFPPGGSDLVARAVAQKVSESVRQPLVVDNRPGAAGTLGTRLAATAAPDGYTLLFATSSFAISAAFSKTLPYDAMSDFAPISLVAAGPFALVVNASLPVNSVKELIALAKAKPDQLNYASTGAGAVGHVDAELFKFRTGIRVTHVPYKGSGLALAAVVAGEVQMMFAPLGTTRPYVRSGKLKALAVAGGQRSALMPELPAIADAGVSDFEAGTWYGVVAPRGTARRTISFLNAEIKRALGLAEIRQKLSALGFEPNPSTPEEFGHLVQADIRKWSALAASGSIVLD